MLEVCCTFFLWKWGILANFTNGSDEFVKYEKKKCRLIERIQLGQEVARAENERGNEHAAKVG